MVGTAWTGGEWYTVISCFLTGTGENSVSRTRKSLWGKGISSPNSLVSGQEKSVMAEAGIKREGDTGGRNLDISGYMNTSITFQAAHMLFHDFGTWIVSI